MPKQSRPRRRYSLVIPVALVAVIVVVVGVAVRDDGRILENVSTAGIAVGGLTATQATAKLNSRLGGQTVRVRVAEGIATVALADVGVVRDIAGAVRRARAVGRTGSAWRRLTERAQTWGGPVPIAMPVALDEPRVTSFVETMGRRFDRRAIESHVEVHGEMASVTPGRQGVEVETAKGSDAVRSWVHAGCRGELTLPAQLTGSSATAGALQGIDRVLSTVSTSLSGSSRNRRHNVALAAAAVDGHVLGPGAIFSYNQVVGPRTEANGYRSAPVIVAGELVPGTGGGACQLSSTLYQVALRSGLEVTARSHHSHPVRYTPAGLDATVVYGALDLRFRNSTSYPVMLLARVRGNRLECSALGHGSPPPVRLLRQVQTVSPPAAQLVDDPQLAPGTRKVEKAARSGVRVRVTLVTAGSPGQGRVISVDYYRPQRAVILVGPAPTAPATTAHPAVAAGTGAAQSGVTDAPAADHAKPAAAQNGASAATSDGGNPGANGASDD